MRDEDKAKQKQTVGISQPDNGILTKWYFRPFFLVAIVGVSIFLGEVLDVPVMSALRSAFPGLSEKSELVIDALFLTAFVSPVLYYFVMRPMILHIKERRQTEDALKESEKKYKQLMDHASDGIFIASMQGNYLDVNSRGCELLGYTREELLRLNMKDIVFSEDLAEAPFRFNELIAGKTVLSERRLRRKDGTPILVEISAKMLPDGRLQAIKRDITERKRTEKELSTLLDISQNISTTLELTKLLDIAVKKTVEVTGVDRVSVVLLDKQGRCVVPAAYTKAGEKAGAGNAFSLDDFLRMKEAVMKKSVVYVPNALDPNTQSPVEIALAKKLNIGSGIHIPLIARDRVVGLLNFAAVGKARWFTEHEIEFYKTIANQLSAMIANAELYEETKRAERVLEISENRLRAIIDAEPECVKIVAADGTVLEMNAAGFALLEAKSADVIIGKSIYSLVAPGYRKAFCLLNENVCRGSKGVLEFEIVGLKGTHLWMETHAVPLSNDTEGRIVALHIARDITERKRAEDTIRNLKEFNEKIIETSPIGIHAIDRNFIVKTWNAYFEDYITIKKSSIIGRNLFEVIPGLLDDGWDKEYRKVMETGKPFEKHDYKYVRSIGPNKGEVLYQSMKIVPLKQKDEIVGAITILEDITERKQAEIELKKKLEELEYINKVLIGRKGQFT